MFLFAGWNRRTSSSRAAGRKDAPTFRVVIEEIDLRTRLPSDVDFVANVVDRALQLNRLGSALFRPNRSRSRWVERRGAINECRLNVVRIVVIRRSFIFEFGLTQSA